MINKYQLYDPVKQKSFAIRAESIAQILTAQELVYNSRRGVVYPITIKNIGISDGKEEKFLIRVRCLLNCNTNDQ